ncbi:hypothetical protein DUI87_18465 [Hirundo rustica rustica]|uniref:Uncharacterized protein n=1 Tax=Hirundo rustica rustica TaxID=333673 RepID=A0A3M0JWN4_HIRRU|nr:hypothetical protein DUI87_18465 [Hirundo rustica rustica]
MHPRVLRELVDVVAKPLSMIFEKSWQSGEAPGDWKKRNIVLIFKKGRKEDLETLSTCQPHLCTWEDLGTDPPTSYAEAQGEQGADSGQQHSLNKGLTNPVAFSDGETTSVDKEKIYRYQLSGVLQGFCQGPQTPFSLNQRDTDSMDGLFYG